MTRRPEPAPGLPGPVSRILLGFAGAEGSGALSESASLLARALSAELSGLYVREAHLHDLAGLPFAATLRPGERAPRPVSAEGIEAAWIREEAACRRALSVAAEARRLAWSFASLSGERVSCLVEAAGRTDLVAVAAPRRGPGPAEAFAALRAAALPAGGALLLPSGARAAPRARAAEPVLALDDGGAGGARAVALAARMAEADGRPLAVLSTEEDSPAAAISERAQTLAAGRAAAVHVLPGWSGHSLSRAIARIGPALVVAEPGGPDAAAEALARRLADAPGPPLILLRPPAGGG